MTKPHTTAKYVPTLCPACKKYMKGGANATECNHCHTAVKPAAQPATKPAAQPATKPAAQPAAKTPTAVEHAAAVAKAAPRGHGEYQSILDYVAKGYVLRSEFNADTERQTSWWVTPDRKYIGCKGLIAELLDCGWLVGVAHGQDGDIFWNEYTINATGLHSLPILSGGKPQSRS
jgi:hypothetical protein